MLGSCRCLTPLVLGLYVRAAPGMDRDPSARRVSGNLIQCWSGIRIRLWDHLGLWLRLWLGFGVVHSTSKITLSCLVVRVGDGGDKITINPTSTSTSSVLYL